ncbi:GNAT family N-acetyltransferase [Crenobacter sp. SG2305]|uniref:GNAT family N-acetyltransferase n=1 Tax=Crenobacter oryzisoli TaxID=3056844 RepID=UPI0025AB4FF9|nr:GNAT family N-acetyltransferase [Crenobacter sp. SG2305]MDN0083722.1 GNAT family N-acetyltransferase [Crenobacter sp. SG2305]
MTILPLPAEKLAEYRDALARLLIDTVEHGASIGYELPITFATAYDWVDGLTASLADGSRRLWLAQGDDGRLLGSVQLELAQRQNGVNRAEVQKLMVASGQRRQGTARRLMAALEAEALALERGLLYLDTEAGSPAEDCYRALGYQRLGELPDYAYGADGVLRATAIYFKTLFRRPTR